MPIARATIAIVALAAGAPVARADEAARADVAQAAGPPRELDLRLTLSTFLYRESGADADPAVAQGAALPNASPARRTFGDLRMELSAEGLRVDARVRQATGARYQAGASAGGEYELRALAYQLGAGATTLSVGRQTIDAVGATRIDGIAVHRRLTDAAAATVFAGAYPVMGSRSLDTDYVRVRGADGRDGALLVPLAGGLGAAYRGAGYHGDVGIAAIYAAQDLGETLDGERSRVFATSSGYGRLGSALDVYHFAVIDVAGASAGRVANGSVGVDARPVDTVQLTGSFHHVSADTLALTARNLLADPDPSALGVVQNNLALVRVSQDVARVAGSVALADRRFELSASGALHRRPEVRVALADGDGAVAFPEARSAEARLSILDRRSLAGLRAQLTGVVTWPLGDAAGNRARGTVVRASVSRGFARERGQLEVDVMGQRYKDVGAAAGACMTSLDAVGCFGTATTIAAQAGVLASWRVGREWLVVADAHAGYRDVRSLGLAGPVAWPAVWSITSLVRIQWRYP